MAAQAFTLFETPLGHCGIAWSERGIVGVQLPEGSEVQTRARLLQRFPEAREAPPPTEAQPAVDGIIALLRGEASDFSSVELDMNAVAPFHRRVYESARAISSGATVSYGEIASRIGSPGASRAVGQALARNPFPIIVPCHRILSAGGKLGGFSANGGIGTKLRLLSMENGRANEASASFERDRMPSLDGIEAVKHLRAVDRGLARLIDSAGPYRLELDKTTSIFAALAEAIVYQQLNGKAASAIFARVRALFPRAHEGLRPEPLLRASDKKLRGAGLSRSKTLSLRDLARKAVDGTLPTLAEVQRMDDESIIERLTEVRGIGRWTAQMLLIFRLGRPDVLPVDDYGIRKGFALAFNKRALPTRQEVEKRGSRWKPYRTVASWYLWRAAEMARH